jgi:hypothetical protein
MVISPTMTEAEHSLIPFLVQASHRQSLRAAEMKVDRLGAQAAAALRITPAKMRRR